MIMESKKMDDKPVKKHKTNKDIIVEYLKKKNQDNEHVIK